jgi:hypothetical protein
LKQFNVARAALHGPPETLQPRVDAARDLFVPLPMLLEPPDKPIPSVDFLQHGIETRRFAGIGEIIAQYAGVPLDDPQLDQYWRLSPRSASE